MLTGVVSYFYNYSRQIFHRISGHSGLDVKFKRHIEKIRSARDFEELCAVYGYEVEDHYLQTKVAFSHAQLDVFSHIDLN